jgi:D-sedoheptulose 7-phosphate isomerase
MNNIDQILSENPDAKQFARGYLSYLSKLLDNLNLDSIVDFIKELEAARKQNRTIFIAGNGGSAATASHMANDIGLAASKVGKEPSFRAFALTDNVSVMTAIANDDGFENMFVHQLKIHYREGDLLIAISASGNSPNILKAAEWVKKKKGKIIGMVGFEGGKLEEQSDIVINPNTPKGEFGPVEDIHMILDHLITSWLYHVA